MVFTQLSKNMKKMLKYKILLLLSLLPLLLPAQADEEFSGFFLTSKYTPGEGLKLKFIPNDPFDLLRGLESGFTVERAIVNEDGSVSGFQKITSSPVRPFTAAQWSQIANGEKHRKAQEDLLQNARKALDEPKSLYEQIRLSQDLRQWAALYVLRFSDSPEASAGSGLEFTDKTVRDGMSCLYRVRLAGAGDQNTSTARAAAEPLAIETASLEATAGDRTAQLRWLHLPGESPWLCYRVEKSEDGKNFTRLTETPLFYNSAIYRQDSTLDAEYMIFGDSLAANFQPYFYRLAGKDYFGEWSSPSQPAKVEGVDLTPPAPPYLVEFSTDEKSKTITLTWEKTEMEPDFTGFTIYRFSDEEGGVTLLNPTPLPPSARSFTLKNAGENEVIRYFIAVTDRYGNSAATLPKTAALDDAFPPAPPTGLNFNLDENGLLTLSWKAGPEADLLGYQVLASMKMEGPFAGVTNEYLKLPVFTDTLSLNRLHRHFYYTVVAVDKHFNKSEPAVAVEVVLPDTTAPAPPVLKNPKKTEGSVLLAWLPSPSEDVSAYRVSRKTMPDGAWELIFTTPNSHTTTYEDRPAAGASYQFHVIALDENGLTSAASNVKEVSFFEKSKPGAATGLTAAAVADAGVELTWTEPKSEVVEYLVFRAENGGEPRVTGSARTNRFKDDGVEAGKIYRYHVLARDAKGRVSEKSELVEVKL